jgi:serine protease inhibitor
MIALVLRAATSRLLRHLDKLGLAEGHSPTGLQGLSAKPLDISEVVQKTVVEVDEGSSTQEVDVTEGSGAAADIVGLVVDKPFTFAVSPEVLLRIQSRATIVPK